MSESGRLRLGVENFDELGRSENEVRVWEMPLIAGHENRTVVKQSQPRFKKRPVLVPCALPRFPR